LKFCGDPEGRKGGARQPRPIKESGIKRQITDA